jgi:heme exporter protein B
MTHLLSELIFKTIYINYKEGTIFINISFYLLITIIFPLCLGTNLVILNKITFGILSIVLILSLILSLDNLFQKDHEDGTLDLLYLTSTPLEFIVILKSFIYWVSYGIPLILITPIIILLMSMNFNIQIFYSLLIITIGLSFWGTMGACLTLGLKQKSFIITIIIIPIYLPILIFSSNLNLLEESTIIIIIFVISCCINTLISSLALRLSFK